jgi:hypothetical protein
MALDGQKPDSSGASGHMIGNELSACDNLLPSFRNWKISANAQ